MEFNKNIYDNIDPQDYEKRQQKNQVEKYQYDHWQPVVSDAIATYSKDSIVLDMGCGPGNHTFEISKYAHTVFGLDSSKKMINYAKIKYPNITFIHADAIDTRLENNYFDTIFSFGLFEYVDNKEKLTKEIHRLLKPNGTAVILAPNRYSFPRFLFFAFYTIAGKKRVCREPSFHQMICIFHKVGFEIINYKMDDGLFFLPFSSNGFIFGKKTWTFIEKLFSGFRRNPFSMNMFFIIKKISTS